MDDGRLHLSSGTEDRLRRTPWESVFFAYAGMAPIAAGAVAFLASNGEFAAWAARATVVFAGAILCFLAGVRRGLSFRQDGGPLFTQLATMLWLFTLGILSLLIPSILVSLALEIIGFATMAIYDPVAARKGEAPRYFQQLRPVQMMIPILSLWLMFASLAASR